MDTSLLTPEQFVQTLLANGPCGNYWTDDGRKSFWFDTDEVPQAPDHWLNTFVGVHPRLAKQDEFHRGKMEDLHSICHVFSEFDAKDYGSKEAILTHIKSLERQPSIIVDSGGGFHCYWLLSEPILISDSNRRTISDLQAWWVSETGGDRDSKDICRVLRVPGTLNFKYDPPRPVEIVSCDTSLTYNASDFLLEFARSQTPKVSKNGNENSKVIHREKFWIEKFAAQCKDGDRNNARVNVACQWRDDGISEDEAKTWIPDWLDASGVGRDDDDAYREMERVIESVYERPAREAAGHTELVTLGKKNGHKKTEEPEDDDDDEGCEPLIMNGEEILSREFPELVWTVDGLMPVGLVVLAGKGKIGKSWMALQLSIAISNQIQFLGRAVRGGNVLYLAYEDSQRRIQGRLRKMGVSKGMIGGVDFSFTWKNLLNGGLDKIKLAAMSGKYALIVIDTFTRAVGARVNQLDTGETTEVFSELQRLGHEHEITILLVDHHSKLATSGDPIIDLYGSVGKGATADIIFGLYRERASRQSVLKGVGRELSDDIDIALQFSKEPVRWDVLGENTRVLILTIPQRRVYEAIGEIDATGKLATTHAISKLVGMDAGNVSRTLKELIDKDLIVQMDKIGVQVPYTRVDRLDALDKDDEEEKQDELAMMVEGEDD